MAEEEKIRIKPFDENGDYRLWTVRVEAAGEAKDLTETLIHDSNI